MLLSLSLHVRRKLNMHLLVAILLIVVTLSGIATQCPSPCLNGGFCSGTICLCPPCFKGTTCETVKEGFPCPCKNGGSCKCYMYYTTQLLPALKFECMCLYGTYGTDCGITTPNTMPPPTTPSLTCTTGCLNGGTSLTGNLCQCFPYYYGNCCEHGVFNGNPCSSDPCQNGGSCTYYWGSTRYVYTCGCPSPYTGTNCQGSGSTLACATNPCKNSGSCVPLSATTYECICPCFHGGLHCEHPIAPLYFFNPCQPDPCANGGTCYCAGHTYKCICRAGFSGPTCASGACTTGTCDNGGYCDTMTSAICTCPATHEGTFCQYLTGSLCLADPCINGGTCVHMSTSTYMCKCPCWVSGNNCEHPGLFLPPVSACSLPWCDVPTRCVCRRTTYECI